MVSMLIVVLMTLHCQASAASAPQYLKLSVESEQIYEGDVVVLEVRHTGLKDEVDYSVLNDIGTIRRETFGTMIAVVSGKVVEIRLRRIEMVPRRRGIVIIGPLQAGQVRSNSVSVEVLEAVHSDWQPGDDDVQVQMSVSVPNPYLQQQIRLDIRLRHRYPIASEQFQLPDLTGFRVIERYAARRPASRRAHEKQTMVPSRLKGMAPIRARLT